MIPELGHFALILALCLSLVQATVPLLGSIYRQPVWMAVARPVAFGQLLFMLLAFAALTWSFVVNDFSVLYVASNSNSALPLIYRISAVWGAHEGSLLLWATILSLWTGAVLIFSRSLTAEMLARVISVLGMISIGFLLFMLLTSNPFERLLPPVADGRDLNPLLQDPGLAIHPPMLYMGYVGFAVPFAFAVAAMIGGRLDAAWARWTRPWTAIAWMFLTLGITLGSWWSYNELGWGGWWFWDPVENASFMPWLVGTALMHSLAVTEKRNAFKAWTVLLAIFTFSLSLLGTFLVRSGVLTSVHAFATDPARGVFILIFLAIVVGGSLTLYAWRAPRIRSSGRFALVSRESALLLNNVLLVVVAASILLGTLYPLIIDALGLGKISVGPPYFNSIFVPLTVPLAALLGFGMLARWKKDRFGRLFRLLRWPLVAAFVLGFGWAALMVPFKPGTVIGLVLALWVIASSLFALWQRVAGKPAPLSALRTVPRGFWGMILGHLGVGLFIVGITLTSLYSAEEDVRLAPGQSYTMNGYTFTFEGIQHTKGPNYTADQGTVVITRGGRTVATLHPQKRIYRVQRMPMTEAGIDAGLKRDLFVALGEPLGQDGSWSLRLYVKPYLRWIWLGAMIMAFGGLLAATDRRYRLARRAEVKLPAGAAAGVA